MCLVARHLGECLFELVADGLQLLLFLVQLVLKTVNLGRKINCLKCRNLNNSEESHETK